MSGVTTAPRREGIRVDIQALRALAVVAVAVGHFFPVRMPGGFVGVDIFFVVSGFLITLHLLREIEKSGRLKLGRFYARRARRLLPAAYTVLAISLAGALLLLPVSRWRDTAAEVFASAAYFQNWLLAAKAAWRPRLVLSIMIAVVGVLSFWSAMVLTDIDLTMAYFVTYTRVWEFAVGTLIAVAAPFLAPTLGRYLVPLTES